MSNTDADGFAKPRKNRNNVRKRPTAEDEDESQEGAMNEREALQKAKLQKKATNTFTTKEDHTNKGVKLLYESDKKLQQASDQGATREVETETATDRDARYVSYCLAAF